MARRPGCRLTRSSLLPSNGSDDVNLHALPFRMPRYRLRAVPGIRDTVARSTGPGSGTMSTFHRGLPPGRLDAQYRAGERAPTCRSRTGCAPSMRWDYALPNWQSKLPHFAGYRVVVRSSWVAISERQTLSLAKQASRCGTSGTGTLGQSQHPRLLPGQRTSEPISRWLNPCVDRRTTSGLHGR